MTYVGDITFFDECPSCGRRVTAATRLVLNVKLDEHVAKCEPLTKKRDDAQASRDRQLDMFGGPK